MYQKKKMGERARINYFFSTSSQTHVFMMEKESFIQEAVLEKKCLTKKTQRTTTVSCAIERTVDTPVALSMVAVETYGLQVAAFSQHMYVRTVQNSITLSCTVRATRHRSISRSGAVAVAISLHRAGGASRTPAHRRARGVVVHLFICPPHSRRPAGLTGT